jgi:iron(III) transport system substrate-binding protein
MKIKALLLFTFVALFNSCKDDSSKASTAASEETVKQEVNVYTHRHYQSDKELFAKFEKETGIQVNVVNAKADELIQKMTMEGDKSPADVLITVDAGRLVRAKNKNLLQAVNSTFLNETVPSHLKDADNHWFGLTKRARVIAYVTDKVNPESLSTYEDLASPIWNKKLLIRSSSNIYNQSLMASLIANMGEDKAKEWAGNVVKNMARSPQGNDRDQVKAIVAGEGDIAVVNTYYIGKLLNSKSEDEVNVAQKVSLFFPNQNDRGTHINVSGAGVAKYAPNKSNAIQFIEFLMSESSQEIFATANYEYPVNPKVAPSDLLKSWGEFKEDQLSLSVLGDNNKKAVLLFDEVNWK